MKLVEPIGIVLCVLVMVWALAHLTKRWRRRKRTEWMLAENDRLDEIINNRRR